MGASWMVQVLESRGRHYFAAQPADFARACALVELGMAVRVWNPCLPCAFNLPSHALFWAAFGVSTAHLRA